MAFQKLDRVALRLSQGDARALRTIATKLRGERGREFVSISDVLRHALQVAAAAEGDSLRPDEVRA